MTKFTRSNNEPAAKSGSSRPASTNRVFGEKVTLGEPVELRGDAELRREIEGSLEMIAKQRLLEAESQAEAFLETTQAEAQSILERANAQAREMIAVAQGQVDAVRDAAHEEGFKAGFQEGYTEATDQVAQETVQLLEGVHGMVEGAYQAERRVLKDFETRALKLVEHVVGRILQRELSGSPEELMHMIEQAVESLYLSGKVRVVLSAQVINDLRQISPKTDEAVDRMNRFELVADPALAPNQVYIISHEGSFELTPEVQAAQLLTPLEGHLDLPRPEPTDPATIDTKSFTAFDQTTDKAAATGDADASTGARTMPTELEQEGEAETATEDSMSMLELLTAHGETISFEEDEETDDNSSSSLTDLPADLPGNLPENDPEQAP